MRTALVFSGLVAYAAAQGVAASIAPSGSPPPGCSSSYNGEFGISPTNLTTSSKRSLKPRDTALTISLKNGVLMDTQGRTGYVAANSQFQFDDPPQTGAIYTAGFTICSNGSLAIGDDAIWYSCLSGDFYNLYYASQGGQCFPVTLQIVGGSPAATSAPAASAPASGAPPATTAPPASSAACTEYVDGQPQCTTAAPAPVCSEYVDGQPQCEPCSEYVDGQPQCMTAAPAPVCSEYVDGQPQCTSAAPAPVCSEYVDGQPQCTSAAPPAPVCSEYVDGQPQCTSAAPSPACSEYVDGQPQCSVATGTMPVASASYTGAPIASGLAVANGVRKEMFGLAAGVLAFAML